MTGDREEPLSGGNVSASVVRIGDTVRRPTGPWTPTVHALLRHLEDVGFSGAPHVFGVDDDGREILEYVPGVIPWAKSHREHLGSDDAMWRSGRLLRELHTASGSFPVPDDAAWREHERADEALPFADHRGVVVCHNDCTAWNLVLGDDRWVFIDWDFAGPRPFIWDVAYALIGLLPVARDPSGLGWREEVPFGRRLVAFAEGYELARRDRARMTDAVIARIRSSYEHGSMKAAEGFEPWKTLWDEGHGDGWADMLAFAMENRVVWERAVT